jgi:carbamoyl-phosphate synthase small subunit
MNGETEMLAVLALEDGKIFTGRPFGAVDALLGQQSRRGEVVFNTAMAGYQEICTDPSYRGQMVVLTYPLIGNYGVALDDAESRRPWLSALLVRECSDDYSNWRAAESLDAYLARNGIPGVCELDTRALTRHLRDHGTLRGVIRAYASSEMPDEATLAALVAEAKSVLNVGQIDVVAEVAQERLTTWPERTPTTAGPETPRVLVIDAGYKRSIVQCLIEHGVQALIAPPDVTLATVRRLQPDGVLLSNGPGDPERLEHLVELTREVVWGLQLPFMGVCLGHQLLGLAAGARTSPLLFGHHGANHPVREVRTERVTITSQNHTFQVEASSIPAESGLYVSHVNLSDGSVEGLAHESLPAFSVQFHPEAAPGPEDNRYLFEQFAEVVKQHWSERSEILAPAG